MYAVRVHGCTSAFYRTDGPQYEASPVAFVVAAAPQGRVPNGSSVTLEAKSVGLMAYSAAVAVYVVSDLHLDENNDARLFRDDRQGRALASLCDQIAQTVRSWSCSATSLT